MPSAAFEWLTSLPDLWQVSFAAKRCRPSVQTPTTSDPRGLDVYRRDRTIDHPGQQPHRRASVLLRPTRRSAAAVPAHPPTAPRHHSPRSAPLTPRSSPANSRGRHHPACDLRPCAASANTAHRRHSLGAPTPTRPPTTTAPGKFTSCLTPPGTIPRATHKHHHRLDHDGCADEAELIGVRRVP